ncbi:hypothetical protein J7426_20335 [Tropicibacter sp. R16_0]|uniref:hypothetical protein n=1 Tax=Tropicibacter sp. R16_0 TaxID=2821102 RepID=UPI001ADB4B1C|nr:hypothetical protein [Tropicibacter sp. R16_0]MBO9452631.1 hypothetical protein [Tropicibacter sp. R16_0]
MRAVYAFVIIVLASPAFADELALWRIGASRFGTDFATDGSTVSGLQQMHYEPEEGGLSGGELADRFGEGVSVGSNVKLHWKGHICVNLRSQPGECDVQIDKDEVKLVRRQKAGRLPLIFEFGIRP